MPRSQKRVHIYLEPDELDLVVRAAARPMRGVPAAQQRNVALVLTMALGGLRVAEVAALDRRDLEGHWLWVWHGKTDKERRNPVHSRLQEALRHYLDVRNDQDPAMFLARGGHRMSDRAIRDLVYAVTEDIEKYRDGTRVLVGPHKLRHTAGTLLAKGNVPTVKIMDILGHETESTAHIYIGEVAGQDDIDAIDYGSTMDLLQERLSER